MVGVITSEYWALRGRVVKASRFETTRPSPFESHERKVSVTNRDCWFTLRNNVFIQLWKLTTIYNQIWLKMT